MPMIFQYTTNVAIPGENYEEKKKTIICNIETIDEGSQNEIKLNAFSPLDESVLCHFIACAWVIRNFARWLMYIIESQCAVRRL